MSLPQFRQYQVVGRHIPTEKDPSPQLYRMKLWAEDEVIAKSKFWYFLKKYKKVKKANGQVIACNELYEKNPTKVKTYGFWVRYQSRSGFHNSYKEYRDLTMNGAVEQLYHEMASRHRTRFSQLQIIKSAIVPSHETKRVNVQQFQDKDLKFPQMYKFIRPSSKTYKTIFKAKRPNLIV